MSAVEILGMVLLGLGTGLLSGFFGVGGGLLMVPGLVLLFSREQHSAQATSLAAMVLIALVGSLRYAAAARAPEVKSAVILGMAGMLGAYFLGAPLANKVPGKSLQQLFGLFVLVVALQMMGLFGWVGQQFSRR